MRLNQLATSWFNFGCRDALITADFGREQSIRTHHVVVQGNHIEQMLIASRLWQEHEYTPIQRHHSPSSCAAAEKKKYALWPKICYPSNNFHLLPLPLEATLSPHHGIRVTEG